jgi:AraC-like DNA-binding protein
MGQRIDNHGMAASFYCSKVISFLSRSGQLSSESTSPSPPPDPNEGQSEFSPKRSLDYVISTRPVVGLKDEYPAGFVDPAHAHQQAQLLYARAGVMSVVTDESTLAVPPQRALWMNAGVRHEVSCRSAVSLRTLYIDPSVELRHHKPCHLVEVSSFLRSLIIEVVNFDRSRPMDDRQELIIKLLLDEIWFMPRAPYQVLMPKDKRLSRACHLITENVANDLSLDEIAKVACMSRRAFTRLFRRETGLSFTVWRQQMRLMEALSLMEGGHSITSTAYAVGYNSPSAFSAAFHRTFGMSPSEHRGGENP